MSRPVSHVGSAGSKVILLGEHAVVHGNDALVLGLTNGIEVTATEVRHTNNRTRLPSELQLQIISWELDTASLLALRGALSQLLSTLGVLSQGIALTVNGNIPPRAGMGASASLGMACARAVNGLLKLEKNDAQLFDAVLEFETVFHQNSSGVDIHAVAHPGCSIFNKKTGLRSLRPVSVPIMVVHSGEPGATKNTVQQFAQHLQSDPTAASSLVRMQQIVTEGCTFLEIAHWQQLGLLMNENHDLLCRFGVSSANLNTICHIALENGALGAKLTGGGGGGCAVILLNATRMAEQKRLLKRVFEKNNFYVVYECMM